MERVFNEEATERINNLDLGMTVPLMESPDYKHRFIAEYVQLGIRACKLEQMITKYKAGELNFEPACPVEVLEEQLQAMVAYLGILQRRDAIEHITDSIGKEVGKE